MVTWMLRVNLSQKARFFFSTRKVDRAGSKGLSRCVNHPAIVVMETGAGGSLGAQEAATAKVEEHQTRSGRPEWTGLWMHEWDLAQREAMRASAPYRGGQSRGKRGVEVYSR